MSAKLAILSLGLWLVGAQAFAAETCCAAMTAPKAACDGCGSHPQPESAPRPDCCTSVEAQQDLDLQLPRSEVIPSVVAVELLTEDPAFTLAGIEGADSDEDEAVFQAERPPLYLRDQVLLI